jgi:hypothetical protein
LQPRRSALVLEERREADHGDRSALERASVSNGIAAAVRTALSHAARIVQVIAVREDMPRDYHIYLTNLLKAHASTICSDCCCTTLPTPNRVAESSRPA